MTETKPALYRKRGNPYMQAMGLSVPVTCRVRSNLTGDRPLYDPNNPAKTDVTMTMPDDGTQPRPYMPKVFPIGRWRILDVRWTDDQNDFTWPVAIITNARQQVKVWALDDNKRYLYETEELVWDSAYEIHACPNSATTFGCIRNGSVDMQIELAKRIKEALDNKELLEIVVED